MPRKCMFAAANRLRTRLARSGGDHQLRAGKAEIQTGARHGSLIFVNRVQSCVEKYRQR